MPVATLGASRHLSADVRALHLHPHAAFDFEPGQHLLVGVPGGPSRCYSMARAPANDGSIELHVQCRPGGAFSDHVVNALKPGDVVALTGPLGAFVFPAGHGPIVMLATGTGVAPFQSMLEAHLASSGHRPITLYWGGRSAEDFYISARLDAWQADHPNFRFVPVLSRRGEGYVQDAAKREIRDFASTTILACGNPAMVAAAHRQFVGGMGVPPARFASDPFDADDEPPVALSGGTGRAVTLRIGGDPIDVPAGISLLAALQAAGRPILSVCGGKASCGTCLVRVAPDWIERLDPPARTERNLLACLPDAGPTGRIACQISLTPWLDGLSLGLPVPA